MGTRFTDRAQSIGCFMDGAGWTLITGKDREELTFS